MLRFISIITLCLLITACGPEYWSNQNRMPVTSSSSSTSSTKNDAPLAQLQPAAGNAPTSIGTADQEFTMCGNYYLGKGGVPKNDVEAFAYCSSAAKKGNPNAMYNLALFYQKGEGVMQNTNEAEKWFKSAADKGQSDAKYNVKQIELAKKGGLGIPKTESQTAAGAGTAAAAASSATNAAPPSQVASAAQPAAAPAAPSAISPTAPTAATASTAAAISTQTAAVPGATTGASLATIAPASGGSKKVPSVDLAQYCLIAAQRGNPDPKCKFGSSSQAAPVAPQAQNNNIDNLVAQAKAGSPQAQNDLGVFYRRGLDNTKKDPTAAQKLFENAASKGSTNGMLNLASMYKDGDVQQNLELAYAWYNLAADRIPPNDPRKAKAQDNVKQISYYINNQQIGNALQYVTKLDEKIPVASETSTVPPSSQTASVTNKLTGEVTPKAETIPR